MPCFTAVASTYGLNEEPTWLRDWSAMSNRAFFPLPL
jgi:hypothetical protein